MRAKHTAPALLAVFSLFCLAACNDRLFDNPYDPGAETRAYEVISTMPTSGIAIIDLAFSGDALWAVDVGSRVLALNYNSGALIRELEVPVAAAGIAYDGEDLWLSVRGTSQLVQVNIVNGAQIHVLNLLRGSFGPLDYSSGRLFVADTLTNSILVVDPQDGSIERSIGQPGSAIDGICHDGASFWTIDAAQMKIFRLAESGALENQYQAPSRTVAGLTFTEGIHWCGDKTGKVYKLRFQ